MIPKILLFLICALFIFTRLYKLTEIPPSVYWDEASIGYNAYTISQNGKDEWGKFLPIHFRAFGEFKLPVYIYTASFFIKVLGLNEFSLRLPSVLFSLGVLILTYLLGKKLLDSISVGLLGSFLVSISPWFFIFSRTGYEATAGLMFYMLAIFFFLKTNENVWYILFSVVSFILSAYSYNSFRFLVPFTILILIIYNFKKLKFFLQKGILSIVLSVIILIISIIPIYRLYRFDAGISRLQVVGGTNATFLTNYLSHFGPDFLLLGDKNPRSQQPGFGQIYLLEIVFLLLGIIYIFKQKSKLASLLVIVLLLAPIPAAITRESPHALRAIAMVPFLHMISAIGIIYFRKLIKLKYSIEFGIAIIFLAFFMNYFLNFLNIYPQKTSKDWQYGYKRIFTDFNDEFSKYDKVIISDEYAQPYIFALFYQREYQNKFRQTVVRNTVDQWGFSTVLSFDKFEFGKVDKLLKPNLEHVLIFATVKEKISLEKINIFPRSQINFLDGTTAFFVYK